MGKTTKTERTIIIVLIAVLIVILVALFKRDKGFSSNNNAQPVKLAPAASQTQ